MKIKKILLVIPANTSGGAERVMCQLANNFSEFGIEVHLVNFDRDTKFYPVSSNVKWYKMNLNFPEGSKAKKILLGTIIEGRRFWYLNKLIRKIKPDMVLPFLEMAEVLTIPNCILTGTPFSVSLRNDYSKYFGYMKILSKLTYHKAKIVVCQTEAVEKELKNSVNCKTTVIENPLDSDTYDNNSIVDKRRKVIISVGRLTKQKNQKNLINAFALIADHFPEYELHIYGIGELKDELQAQIDSLHLTNRVILKGVLHNAIKENKDAALFVMSSDFEGFPNTLIEAMANGIPVISTDFKTKAAKKLLKDGEIGGLVSVDNSEELANAIAKVLENPEQAETMAVRGKYVIDMLDAKCICKRWIDVMEQ